MRLKAIMAWFGVLKVKSRITDITTVSLASLQQTSYQILKDLEKIKKRGPVEVLEKGTVCFTYSRAPN